MGKTIEVAENRAYDETKTVLPQEVAQGVYIQHAPSLKALKLMHLMIAKAGGRMADDVTHEMRLSDMKQIEGMDNLTRTRIIPLFAELRAATIIHDDTQKMRITIGGILDETTVDYRHELSGDILIKWGFGRTFRRIAKESNYWAILDRQALFHLGSKYSVLLFQHISSLTSMKHNKSKRFSVAELRSILGVSEGKLTRFSHLKHRAIQPAIVEINSDLTRLNLTASYHKIGRTVAEVEIAWEVDEDLTKIKFEQDKSSGLEFPSSGRIHGKWEKIALENTPHLQGNHTPDLLVLSNKFRKWCAEKPLKLDAKTIEKTFTTWCRKYSPR